jgi:hypothetical protein
VGEGEATTVDVQVENAPAVSLVEVASEPSDEEGGSIWSSPWLWAGAGAVVLAAILIPIFVAVGTAQESPHMGTLGAGTLTFE